MKNVNSVNSEYLKTELDNRIYNKKMVARKPKTIKKIYKKYEQDHS